MAPIDKQQGCSPFHKGPQALGGGLAPQVGLQACCRGFSHHVPGSESGSQDGDEGEDSHVAKGGDEGGAEAHTAKQQGILPASQQPTIYTPAVQVEISCSQPHALGVV